MVSRTLIVTGKAISLKEVARNIAKVIVENGGIATPTTKFNPAVIRRSAYDSIIFFFPADPVYALEYCGYYSIFKPSFGDKCMFYTTIEGRPEPILANKPVFKYVDWIANSDYTRIKLLDANWKCDKIVYHGVDIRLIDSLTPIARKMRRKVKEQFKDKVVFGLVSAWNVRKGIEKLIVAMRQVNEKHKDEYVVLAITEYNEGKAVLPENFIVTASFGSLPTNQILAFYQTIDFLIAPTMCEGFGMPVLEAMASKTPVIHGWFKPLSEFSDPEGNIVFPYTDTREVKSKGGLLFELHEYDPQDLAMCIEEAITIYKDNKEEYEDKRERVRVAAEKYDIRKTYKYFVDKIM